MVKQKPNVCVYVAMCKNNMTDHHKTEAAARTDGFEVKLQKQSENTKICSVRHGRQAYLPMAGIPAHGICTFLSLLNINGPFVVELRPKNVLDILASFTFDLSACKM